MKRLALAVAILIALIESAWSDYLVGLRAYVRGDYAGALLEWRPLAEQGNAQAQFYLGDIYEWGLGVPQDYTEAVKWYRKAADQGHADAQSLLGDMYYEGRGVPQYYAAAMKWYRKAAEQGFASAKTKLGGMYYESRGVPRDYAEAVKWYRKAAEQGYAPAQHNLGLMYDKGRGVPGTMPRRWGGTAKRPSRNAPLLRITSGSCTRMAGASRRITSGPTCGSVWPPHAWRPDPTGI